MSPNERSRKALEGVNVRQVLEASNLPVEIATAIADALEIVKPEVCSKCGKPFPHSMAECLSPEAGGTSFTTVEFCGKPAAAPCAIEEQCQYGKDRDMVIEECAKVCESRAGSQAMAAFRILTSAADAIRGLKSREPQGERHG